MEPWYWVVIIAVLVVFYVLLVVRQKRQEKRNLEALNQFKVGDKVVTHIGVFGKIKRIYNTTYGKICVLEVGVNNKVDIEMDLRYIAAIDEKTIAPEEPAKVEEKPTKEAETKTEQPENEESQQPKEQSKNKKSK